MSKAPFMPPQGSSFAGQVDLLYLFLVAISLFFSLLIAGLIVYLAVRYKRRSPRDIGVPIHGSGVLEIAWSVIPLVIMLGSFVWGTMLFFHLSRPPADAVEYFAVGKQWMWKFQHPDGTREINTLHLPVGQPVKVTLTSEDVIHDLFVPAFRVKMDVLPARYSTIWFEPVRVGTYHLFCAEYCGAEHSRMGGWIVVQEPEDYERWLAGERGQENRLASPEDLFKRFACESCHRTDSVARAPQLAGLFGKQVRFKDGSAIVADDNYILESILKPNEKIVAGYQPIMPTFQGQMSQEEALALVRYVRGLEAGK